MNEDKNNAIPSRLSRHDFFTLAWKSLLGISGLLGISVIWRYFSYQPYPSRPTVFDLGPVEEIPPNAVIPISEAQAVIIPARNGFKALSMVCPHLGCIIENDEDGFKCPCHGSRFGYDGTVKNGPATESLAPLHLEINDEGHLILDTSKTF